MQPTSSPASASRPVATAVEILQELLADPTNLGLVNRLVTTDVTYVSLN